jgi:hypothetical protein
LEGEGERLARKAVELALAGDVVALRLCLDRICPPRRGRSVTFELPARSTAGDFSFSQTLCALLTATASGQISPEEASSIAQVIEFARRSIETEELERRLSELEARK